MSEKLLDAVVVGPDDASYSVIWMHGLGADGYDFEPIVPELQFKNKSKTRFIFPHAPARPVTINNGYVMPAWFDIHAIDEKAPQDEAGIRDTAKKITALISREHQRGVSSEHIVLAGFSQGGAIALHTALRYPHRLAGILALSTFLPLYDKVASEVSSANKDIPIYMAHGNYDPVVPLRLAKLSQKQLHELGYHVDWHEYPMEHSVIPPEIDDISTWFGKVLV